MNKKKFKELTGENPEDVLGGDWENEAKELNEPDPDFLYDKWVEENLK